MRSILSAVIEAFARRNVQAEPVVYLDEMADDARDELLEFDGVLVWVDPIAFGQDRSRLDALLRDVASRGVFVSAHPGTILKMDTKEVVYDTRDFGWGTDTYLYRTLSDFLIRVSGAA